MWSVECTHRQCLLCIYVWYVMSVKEIGPAEMGHDAQNWNPSYRMSQLNFSCSHCYIQYFMEMCSHLWLSNDTEYSRTRKDIKWLQYQEVCVIKLTIISSLINLVVPCRHVIGFVLVHTTFPILTFGWINMKVCIWLNCPEGNLVDSGDPFPESQPCGRHLWNIKHRIGCHEIIDRYLRLAKET